MYIIVELFMLLLGYLRRMYKSQTQAKMSK